MRYRPIMRSLAATLENLAPKVSKAPSHATLESIAFQHNDYFGPLLESIVSKYKDLVDSGASQKAIKNAKELKSELIEAVKARLGIKIDLITDQGIASVIPNVFIPHNPVIRDDLRVIYEEFPHIAGQNKLKGLKNKAVIGTVNTQTAKVTGWFSEQEAPVFINFFKLFKVWNLSVPEVTAIVLHELGHIFEAIIFSSNVNTTNQVLADIAKHIEGKPDNTDINYIYSKLKTIDKDATRDIAEGLASGDKVVMSTATYRLLMGITRSLMSDSTYDKTGFEALADNFTTKFGYGEQLVTGLEAMEKVDSEYSYHKYMYEYFKEAMIVSAIITIVFSIVGVAAIKAGMFIIGPIFSVLGFIFGYGFTVLLNTQRVSTMDMTYDKIRERYLRVRNQLVEVIKNDEVPKTTKEAVLSQIKSIDEIASKKIAFENPITKAALMIFPADRRAFDSIRNQQELEKIIANDLFISAARLSIKG